MAETGPSTSAASLPTSVVAENIAIAAREARRLLELDERIEAIGVIGSTALGRCGKGSDLDLAAIVRGRPDEVVTTMQVGDLRVDVEWLDRREALAIASSGGWTWELRKSARLGLAIPLYDPGKLFEDLAQRARATGPDVGRYAAELQAVKAALAGLANRDRANAGLAESLRGVLDSLAMLVLMTTPRRYQKPKWTVEDLLAADAPLLVSALLDAFGAATRDETDARDRIAAAEACANAVLDHLREPSVDALVAMGYAPDHAEASYCARTLEDARDLARAARFAEASYVASFAARLAVGLLGAGDSGGLAAIAESAGLGARYRACFPERRPRPQEIAIAGDAYERCARWLAERRAPARGEF